MINRFLTSLRNEPTRVAAILCLVACSLWAIASLAVVEGLIADGWNGRGLGLLNRFFASRGSRKPLEHYLNLWQDLRNAVFLGFIAFGLLLGLIRIVIRNTGTQAFLLVFSVFFLALTILWGPRQDYVAHLEIWRQVAAGNDPWWIQPGSGIVLNAYGPLFELFAWPVMQIPLAPKILFAISYLVYCISMLRIFADDEASSRFETKLLCVWLANPFFWLEIAFYGHFDVLMAVLCVAAVISFDHGRPSASGLLLGLGFLLKFLPVVLVPFLAIERKRRLVIHWRLAITAGVVMLSGMAAAWSVWGSSVFRPLAFAAGRGSSLLSVWRYLKGSHSPFVLLGYSAPNFDSLSTPTMAVILAVVWWLHAAKRFVPVHSCLLAVLTTLIFYRVGFVQYQVLLFLLLPYWYSSLRESIRHSWGTKAALAAYVSWIIAFDLFDNAVGGIVGFDRPYGWMEDWVGLPTFLVGMALWIALARMPGRTYADITTGNARPA